MDAVMEQSQGDRNIYGTVPQGEQSSKRQAGWGRSHCRLALDGNSSIHVTVLRTTASWYLSTRMCNS